MNLSDWKQAAQRSAATEKLQLVIVERSAELHSAAQPSAAYVWTGHNSASGVNFRNFALLFQWKEAEKWAELSA